MTDKQKIKVAILKALCSADGTPMPDEALLGAALAMVFPRPTVAEVRLAGQELELEQWISGSSHPLTGVTWSLTVKGIHEAQKL